MITIAADTLRRRVETLEIVESTRRLCRLPPLTTEQRVSLLAGA